MNATQEIQKEFPWVERKGHPIGIQIQKHGMESYENVNIS
jgi:hypothetical protein